MVGICAAVERARWSFWDQPAALTPLSVPSAVQRAGGVAVLLPPDGRLAQSPQEIVDRLDALLVAGGADIDPASYGGEPHPQILETNTDRDRFEISLCRGAIEADLPLLGICRGMQVLNVAAGGRLDPHLPDRLGHERHRPVPGQWAEHEVRLQPASLAARAAGAERLTVKSHHHQGVDDLGEGFEVSGWSLDDDATVEAIESPALRFGLGVLWHPEEDPEDRVIGAVVAAAEKKT